MNLIVSQSYTRSKFGYKIFPILEQIAINNVALNNRFKMAAAIAIRGTVIATGINQYKTHPLMEKYSKTKEHVFIHAEIDAIKNALKTVSTDILAKCDLYVLRIKRPDNESENWVHGLAKPCSGCCKAIGAFNLKNVFYTENA